jgi:TolB protein
MLRIAAFAMLAFGVGASAQQTPGPLEVDVVGGQNAPGVIAVPSMPTPAVAVTAAGDTASLGQQVSSVIASDLRSSGAFNPIGPDGVPTYVFAEAGAPAFPQWRSAGAQALVTGFVQSRGDGKITVGCYLYDVTAGRELARQGFVVAPTDWRRAAHKCADTVYARMTGEGAFFDSRVVYVAETGPANARVKRIAVMDSDGTNHRYLTMGRATVITPRFSPNGDYLAYMSYAGRVPRIWIKNMRSGAEHLLVPGKVTTFAPRFSPDSRRIVFSMSTAGNTDIYVANVDGGAPQRLTSAPGADTSPSFSPDGSKIVFESDRSGTQQLYVMSADGSGQRRISFGGARYASPVWSPRGDLIAFTRIGGTFNIGVMSPSGSGEKTLTNGWQDEGPSWAPNGKFVMFSRTERGTGRDKLYAVSIDGGPARLMPTPMDGSDPSWSPQN